MIDPTAGFRPRVDLISLHYDHAPDKDDGHSAAADRTILESEYDCAFIKERTTVVAGTYGTNRGSYNTGSEAVMTAVFDPCGGYLNAHRDRAKALATVIARWSSVLKGGGNIWVKEGGQSDFTADVVRAIRQQLPQIDCKTRVKVVQHSNWNEDKTTAADLAYVQKETAYRKIRDANAYLNKQGGDTAFERAAIAHPVFKTAWKAAFSYYDPSTRLDFSDTGELMNILNLGEMGIDAFRTRYLR